jgi:DNA-binding CsgD family transcriptional regulator
MLGCFADGKARVRLYHGPVHRGRLDLDSIAIETWPAVANSLEQTLRRLREAIERAQLELVRAGGDYESLRRLARSLAADLLKPLSSGDLTPQERRVAILVAAGRSDLEAATVLHLSVNTVRSHMKHILRKLELHSRWQIRQALSQSSVPREAIHPTNDSEQLTANAG